MERRKDHGEKQHNQKGSERIVIVLRTKVTAKKHKEEREQISKLGETKLRDKFDDSAKRHYKVNHAGQLWRCNETGYGRTDARKEQLFRVFLMAIFAGVTNQNFEKYI